MNIGYERKLQTRENNIFILPAMSLQEVNGQDSLQLPDLYLSLSL